MFKDDVLANVLYIDLSQKKYWVERREELFEKYLGGAGVAMFKSPHTGNLGESHCWRKECGSSSFSRIRSNGNKGSKFYSFIFSYSW